MEERRTTTERPGLQMLRPDLEELPPLQPALAALPRTYNFRTYRPGDEDAWAALMNTGEMGLWTRERTIAELTGKALPHFDPAGLFVITTDRNEQLVGSAAAWVAAPTERETGILHMVCVLPEHRGQRLSFLLCLAVLHRFRERGFHRVRLHTHEWRLGAIKVYLELGFRPLYSHPLHEQQWREVAERLGLTTPPLPAPGTPSAGQ